jgi:hypothetical protein
VFATDCPESCGTHEEHCQTCDEKFRIFADWREMLAVLEESGASGVTDFRYIIDTAEMDLDRYIAHRVRTHVEEVASRARRANLGPGQAEMTVDYKMKWTAMVGGVFVSLCRCVVVWLCGCVAVWLCGCVVVWLCGCVAVWLCGCVVVWLCGCVAVWLCGCVVVTGPLDRCAAVCSGNPTL